MAAEWHLWKNFDYDGQSVAYDTLGEGNPIVLIHGTPFSSYVWRNNPAEKGGGDSAFHQHWVAKPCLLQAGIQNLERFRKIPRRPTPLRSALGHEQTLKAVVSCVRFHG